MLKHQDQSHLGRAGFISAYRWEAILKESQIRNLEVPEAEAAENHCLLVFSPWLAQPTLWNTQGPPCQGWHSHFSRKWPTDFLAGQPDRGDLSAESSSFQPTPARQKKNQPAHHPSLKTWIQSPSNQMKSTQSQVGMCCNSSTGRQQKVVSGTYWKSALSYRTILLAK